MTCGRRTFLHGVADLWADARLPASYPLQRWTDSGGLMTYVDNIFPIVRRVGNYVARILNGELPAAMPIEYPAKFELVINLKTAKALGLTIPQSLFLRVDEVIQ